MAESVQTVVSALNVLYENPDASAKEKANAWLQEFQKSVSQWIGSWMLKRGSGVEKSLERFGALSR